MSNLNQINRQQQHQLMTIARQALQQAYAPYSRFRVGAAVLTEQGNIFTGCNVENISYGLSLCAERNAITTAVGVEGGDTMKLKAIAIANDRQTCCSPCGACRQVIWEFGHHALIILQSNPELQTIEIAELLPEGFSF